MIKLKNIISFFISLIVIICIAINFDTVKDKVMELIYGKQPVIKEANQYYKDDEFMFAKMSSNYNPTNYQDLIDIFYSSLNNGWKEFTFYCPVEYENCIDDVTAISHNQVLLSDLNNFVHPYNSYSTIKIFYDDAGTITIKVTRLYDDNEIKKIDYEIDKIIKELVTDDMSDRDKIKVLHDYIINNTKYDQNDKETTIYDSSRINGLLFEHFAVCSGYTDTMAVMLEKLDIKNYKIASEAHVWNAVFIDGYWRHLDLTWDDPIVASGKDILDDSYFLIDSDKLEELDKKEKEHIFDTSVYLEFKNN